MFPYQTSLRGGMMIEANDEAAGMIGCGHHKVR